MEHILAYLLYALFKGYQWFFALGGPAAALGGIAGAALGRSHKWRGAMIGVAVGLALWHGAWWWFLKPLIRT